MKLESAFGNTPTVDFADFYFEGDGYNYDTAKKLALLLIDEVDIDELKGIYNDVETFDSSVGTGGSGGNYPCPSLASQRACLASVFANFANCKYRHVYLSKYEFYCLRNLLNYLEEEVIVADYRESIHNANVEVLKLVLKEFISHYYKVDKEFIVELL